MVVKKHKKLVSMRGTRTHGYGRAHRGSGNKGGYGNAGGGKKADHMKRSFPADYFGKEGFVLHSSKRAIIINIRDLDSRIESWVKDNTAKKEGDTYHVDLGTLGIDKLVGGGKVTHKMKVTVAAVATGAAEKLKLAGGEVIVG